MATTTIRLTEDLKTRVAEAAKTAGTTAHAFILEAIAEKTDRQERQSAFNAEAEARYERIVSTGKTIPWSEMRACLEARIEGRAVKSPSARKLSR